MSTTNNKLFLGSAACAFLATSTLLTGCSEDKDCIPWDLAAKDCDGTSSKGNQTSHSQACVPAADNAEKFIEAVQKIYHGEKLPDALAKANKTGFFKEDAVFTFMPKGMNSTNATNATNTNATDTDIERLEFSAEELWAELMNYGNAGNATLVKSNSTNSTNTTKPSTFDAVDLANFFNAEQWNEFNLDQELMALIGVNFDSKGAARNGNGTMVQNTTVAEMRSKAGDWKGDGQCVANSAGTPCDHYLDCADDVSAFSWAAAQKAAMKGQRDVFGIVGYFTKKNHEQKRYCDFKDRVCKDKKKGTQNIVNFDGVTVAETGIKCSSQYGVAANYFCDSRDDHGLKLDVDGTSGILADIKDYKQLFQNDGRQPCTQALDCVDEGKLHCLNVTYAAASDGVRSSLAEMFGVCSPAPPSADIEGASNPKHYTGYPYVLAATKRSDLEGSDLPRGLACVPRKLKIEKSVNGTESDEVIYSYETPEFLSPVQYCEEIDSSVLEYEKNGKPIHDTNENIFTVTSMVSVSNKAIAAFDPTTESNADAYARALALYDNFGLILKGGRLTYADECSSSSECGGHQYCKRKQIQVSQTTKDALNAVPNSLKLKQEGNWVEPGRYQAKDFYAQDDLLQLYDLLDADSRTSAPTLLQQMYQFTKLSTGVCVDIPKVDLAEFQTNLDFFLTTSVDMGQKSSEDGQVYCNGQNVAVNQGAAAVSTACGADAKGIALFNQRRNQALSIYPNLLISNCTDAVCQIEKEGSWLFDVDIEGNVVSEGCFAAGLTAEYIQEPTDEEAPVLQITNDADQWFNQWMPRGVFQQVIDEADAKNAFAGVCAANGIFRTADVDGVEKDSDYTCYDVNQKYLSSLSITDAATAKEQFSGWRAQERTAKVWYSATAGGPMVEAKAAMIISCVSPQVLAGSFGPIAQSVEKPTQTPKDFVATFTDYASTKAYLGETNDNYPTAGKDTGADRDSAYIQTSFCSPADNSAAGLQLQNGFPDFGVYYETSSTWKIINCKQAQCQRDTDCFVYAHQKATSDEAVSLAEFQTYSQKLQMLSEFGQTAKGLPAFAELSTNAYACVEDPDNRFTKTCTAAPVQCSEDSKDACSVFESCKSTENLGDSATNTFQCAINNVVTGVQKDDDGNDQLEQLAWVDGVYAPQTNSSVPAEL